MRRLVSLLILAVPAIAAAKTYNAGKGDTFDCGKGDASITINVNDGTYVFKGACDSVSVNGNNNKITVASSSDISVNGNRNVVDVTAVDAITTNGNDNRVTYAKGVTKSKPSTSSPGTSNTIAVGGAKSADKPAADKPATDKPAADKPAPDAGGDAGVIDCAKHPTYSIPNGKGTYKFSGTCDKISVTGGENALSIEAVKELAVAGASNVIDVGAAGKISVVGSNNKISYKKGISSAKPVTKVVGTNNKLAQVK